MLFSRIADGCPARKTELRTPSCGRRNESSVIPTGVVRESHNNGLGVQHSIEKDVISTDSRPSLPAGQDSGGPSWLTFLVT